MGQNWTYFDTMLVCTSYQDFLSCYLLLSAVCKSSYLLWNALRLSHLPQQQSCGRRRSKDSSNSLKFIRTTLIATINLIAETAYCCPTLADVFLSIFCGHAVAWATTSDGHSMYWSLLFFCPLVHFGLLKMWLCTGNAQNVVIVMNFLM